MYNSHSKGKSQVPTSRQGATSSYPFSLAMLLLESAATMYWDFNRNMPPTTSDYGASLCQTRFK